MRLEWMFVIRIYVVVVVVVVVLKQTRTVG